MGRKSETVKQRRSLLTDVPLDFLKVRWSSDKRYSLAGRQEGE